jgi:protein arginine kinase activator
MPCEQCREREAVIHLTQIVNEQVTTLHLCERCAAEKGVDSPGAQPKTPLGTFLAAMGQEAEQTQAPRPETCVRCGGSLQDFRESGRLGCPDCYRSFEVPLRDLLRRLHGSTHHMGERYAEEGGTRPPPAQRQQATELREQLRLAVETENFELAAELRDRLRVME